MPDFPRLQPGNAAVIDLKDWLEGEREKARNSLETETERDEILRKQGRVSLIKEMLKSIDPEHRRSGSGIDNLAGSPIWWGSPAS